MKRELGLRDLSDDHHAALVLARRCKGAAAAASSVGAAALWQEVQGAFASQLEPHFQIEERHLLPALEAIGEARLAERIREDHAALRASTASTAPAPDAIAAFGSRLESHVRFEEREVFGPTQGRLPAASLRAIADAWRATPRSRPADGRAPRRASSGNGE